MINTEVLAGKIAQETLNRYPNLWRGKRTWANEQMVDIAENLLDDEQLPEESREEVAREACQEWIVESYHNRR
jgi:hypothetical protein